MLPAIVLAVPGPAIFFIMVFAVLTLVVQLALIIWTYADATENSGQPAFLWAIVVFLAPLLGIVLYFLLGRTALD